MFQWMNITANGSQFDITTNYSLNPQGGARAQNMLHIAYHLLDTRPFCFLTAAISWQVSCQ